MNHVYVDTGFWIALLDAKDEHHTVAKKIFIEFFTTGSTVIMTSDFVIGETVTYLNCSLRCHDLAMAFLHRLNDSPLQILACNAKVKTDAMAILKRYDNVPLSYADCISFALMAENAIRYFAGFDRHFTMMGFQQLLPGISTNKK